MVEGLLPMVEGGASTLICQFPLKTHSCLEGRLYEDFCPYQNMGNISHAQNGAFCLLHVTCLVCSAMYFILVWYFGFVPLCSITLWEWISNFGNVLCNHLRVNLRCRGVLCFPGILCPSHGGALLGWSFTNQKIFSVFFWNGISQTRWYSLWPSWTAFPKSSGIFLVCYSGFMLVVANNLCMLGKIMDPIFDTTMVL